MNTKTSTQKMLATASMVTAPMRSILISCDYFKCFGYITLGRIKIILIGIYGNILYNEFLMGISYRNLWNFLKRSDKGLRRLLNIK